MSRRQKHKLGLSGAGSKKKTAKARLLAMTEEAKTTAPLGLLLRKFERLAGEGFCNLECKPKCTATEKESEEKEEESGWPLSWSGEEVNELIAPDLNAIVRLATELASSMENQYETLFDRKATDKMTNVIDHIALRQAKGTTCGGPATRTGALVIQGPGRQNWGPFPDWLMHFSCTPFGPRNCWLHKVGKYPNLFIGNVLVFLSKPNV